jgi:hypothetical protein
MWRTIFEVSVSTGVVLFLFLCLGGALLLLVTHPGVFVLIFGGLLFLFLVYATHQVLFE